MNKKIALIIMDGWGHKDSTAHNAIALGHTPNYDHLFNTYPKSFLDASGEAVGLPAGQMGNSEIGHTAIGAGKAIYTDILKINKAIETGDFFENEAFHTLFKHCKDHNSSMHIMGLLSDGGVHSHEEHLFAFLKLCKNEGFSKHQVILHIFTDGRDTTPGTAAASIKKLEDLLDELQVGVIASIGGRYFGMDRAGNDDRIKMVTDIMFHCEGDMCTIEEHGSASKFMQSHYSEDPTGKIDEYMKHYVVSQNEQTFNVQKNDGFFFFNFRADRTRQITREILKKQEELNLCFISMTQYGDDIDTIIAFPPETIETCLAKELAAAGKKQIHISESEKFPHVTFFLNGQSDAVYANEHHIKIESRTDVATHDEAPEMKSAEIVSAFKQAFTEHDADFVVINFPNADVVGHTGNMDAIIKAVEAVDVALGDIYAFSQERNITLLVSADHGNAETMIDDMTGEKHTAHTLNQVPFIVTNSSLTLSATGTIADMTPTILDLFGITKPKTMTGSSLLTR